MSELDRRQSAVRPASVDCSKSGLEGAQLWFARENGDRDQRKADSRRAFAPWFQI